MTLAHKYRRYSDGLAWCDTSLASPAAAQDHLGRAALHAMRARLHRALGDLPATLTEVARAREVLAGVPAESDQPAASWATRRRTEEFAGYDAGYAHSMLGDNAEARAEADRLRDLSHDDDGLELALDLAFLVAYYEEDFDGPAPWWQARGAHARSQSHASTPPQRPRRHGPPGGQAPSGAGAAAPGARRRSSPSVTRTR